MTQRKVALLKRGLIALSLTLSAHAAAINTARFSVSNTSGTVAAGATSTQTVTVTNNGPDAGTNVVVTYNAPTTAGITVGSVTASPGGACIKSGTTFTCPAVASVANGGTVTLQISVTVDSTVAGGTTAPSTTKVDSAEFNPGSGVGESLFSTWGATAESAKAGDAFWFAFDGTYTNTGNKVEGASNDIATAWPPAQAFPPGAYNIKDDTAAVDWYTNSANAINPYGTTAPTTTVGPKNQSIVTTPPTVSLAQIVVSGSAAKQARDNRRVWEVRTGIYLPQASPLYVCVKQPDDGMYVAIDDTSVAFANVYNSGVVVNATSNTYAAGYHQIVYRIINRNDQISSWEGGKGSFGELGIGSTQGSCTTPSYNTFTNVAPSTDATVVSTLSISKTATPYIKVSDPASNTSTAALPNSALTPGTITYTLNVSNAGGASNVRVTDNLPAGLTYDANSARIAYSTSTGSYGTPSAITNTGSATALAFAVPTLNAAEPGKSAQITFTATPTIAGNTNVTSTAGAAAYSNTASVTAPNIAAQTSAPALTNVVYTKLRKTVTNTAVSSRGGNGLPGDVMEYCLAYNNYGSVDLSNYSITDPVPSRTLAKLDGYGAGYGIKLTRTVSGTTSSAPLTSAADTVDAGSLTTSGSDYGQGNMSLGLGKVTAGESGSACFRVGIR